MKFIKIIYAILLILAIFYSKNVNLNHLQAIGSVLFILFSVYYNKNNNIRKAVFYLVLAFIFEPYFNLFNFYNNLLSQSVTFTIVAIGMLVDALTKFENELDFNEFETAQERTNS